MKAFTLAGGELAGTTIQIDELLVGIVQPIVRVPNGSGDTREDWLIIVSKDQTWLSLLWPASRGAANRRRTAIYRRIDNEFIWTGEGRKNSPAD